MKRRQWLRWGCASCLGGSCLLGNAQATAAWSPPERLQAPALDSDEGGLWAMMEREERRLRRSPFLIRDEKLQRYLEGIVRRLAGDHAQDMRVFPVRQSMFNASMAPNGQMQVWSGLLLRVENEAQLAAVIGHEIGHFFERHTLQRLRDAKSRSAFGMFLGMFGVVGLIGQLATVAGAFGFSRDHERQADLIGMHLMRRGGYDTVQASLVWRNLQQELAASHGGDPGQGSILFATHPASEERRQNLLDWAQGDERGFTGEQELFDALAGVRLQLLDDELRRGQYGQSLVLLSRWLERFPARPDFLHYRGETLRLRNADGDAAGALKDFEAALALPDPLPITHRSLGYWWRAQGDGAKAKAAFENYLAAAPAAGDADLIHAELKSLS